MTPNLDSPNVSARLRQIAAAVKDAPHVLDQARPDYVHERLQRIASELGPNPATVEDLCFLVLSVKSAHAVRDCLISFWQLEDRISEEQAATMRCICGLA